MWQARLISAVHELEKTVDCVRMTVDLFHTDGRTKRKEYLLWVDEIETVSLVSLKAKVQVDIDRLTKLDTILSALNTKIGVVI